MKLMYIYSHHVYYNKLNFFYHIRTVEHMYLKQFTRWKVVTGS